MLIRKSNIGGEILSIITRGMYFDPKAVLRECVQNGVDANANEISIKIRQDTVVIVDNGEVWIKIPCEDISGAKTPEYSSHTPCLEK